MSFIGRKKDTFIKKGKEFNEVGEKSSLTGEVYYYKNIPKEISNLFPKFINCLSEKSTDVLSVKTIITSYEMEKISGPTLSYLYINKSFTEEILDNLLKNIKKIHSCKPINEQKINIYCNYTEKLKSRYQSNIYIAFNNTKILFDYLTSELNQYEKENKGIQTVIHGDCVLGNVLLDKDNTLKFIDMRGKVGDILTIEGDIMYDYAKIYQSLIGYDFILNNKEIDIEYCNKWSKLFLEKLNLINNKYLKIITSSLLFGLIPLHHDDGYDKCNKYYMMACELIKSFD